MSAPDSISHGGHRGRKVPPRPRFPLEIPLYGPSPAVVRAVSEGLARALPDSLRVALVADPHGSQAAFGSATSGPSPNRVRLWAPAWNSDSLRAALADCDLALTEGLPSPGLPGILVLPTGVDPRPGNIPDTSGAAAPAPALLACVASFANPGALPDGIPVFSPDRMADLAAVVLERARAVLSAGPLYGLVLGGGRSLRMGADKAALTYHGKPQTEHCLELLGPHCAQAFLSCRADQSDAPGFAGLPQIHDTFSDLGPLSGILSALRAHPGAAFLVIACDLPWLDAATLATLVAGRDPFKVATAFMGAHGGLPEPLCAIYEARAYARALQLMGQGLDCPRKLILNSSVALLSAPEARALRNANLPEDRQEAIRSFSA